MNDDNILSDPMEEFVELPACGMVSVVGRANVGKSSLINAMLEEKVSIVSPVPQTTRNLIRSIYNDPRGQLVFLDTPGVHKAPSDLGRIMNQTARVATKGVDAVLLVLDGAKSPRMEDRGWMTRLIKEEIPLIFLANKKDLGSFDIAPYQEMWEKVCSEQEDRADVNVAWLTSSVVEQDGVKELLEVLFSLMKPGPALFPQNILTDYPKKLAVADVIREKLFLKLREELPHSIAVSVEELDESEEGWDVQATIYAQKHTQRAIILGHKGRVIRSVKRASTRELESMYDVPIQLRLWVKVEKKWEKNFWLMKKFGYMQQ